MLTWDTESDGLMSTLNEWNSEGVISGAVALPRLVSINESECADSVSPSVLSKEVQNLFHAGPSLVESTAVEPLLVSLVSSCFI